MGDRISLCNMTFWGYHGAMGAEKELGQRFEVDVELHADLQGAGQADDLESALDYVAVYTVVKHVVEDGKFNLLEAMAEAIAQQILSMYDIEQVKVRVRKPSVPIGGLLDCVQVEIVRRDPRHG